MTQNLFKSNTERFNNELQYYMSQSSTKVRSIVRLKMGDIFNLQKSEPYHPRPEFYPPSEAFQPYKDPRVKIFDRKQTAADLRPRFGNPLLLPEHGRGATGQFTDD
jgi:hypothetical protein